MNFVGRRQQEVAGRLSLGRPGSRQQGKLGQTALPDSLHSAVAIFPYFFFTACWSLAQGSFRVTVRLKTGAPGRLSLPSTQK